MPDKNVSSTMTYFDLKDIERVQSLKSLNPAERGLRLG